MTAGALRSRVLTAVIGIPLLFVLLWLGGPWWAVLAFAVAGLGAVEFIRLRRLNDLFQVLLLGLLVLAYAMALFGESAVAGWLIAAWVVVLITAGLLPLRRAGAMPSAATSALLGAAYLGVPMGLLARWRLDGPPHPVLAFLLMIWANDIAAYFMGSAFGRHKLAPRISPGKSWEGAIAGVVAAAIVGWISAPWLGLSVAGTVAFAAVVTVASQAGDLFESAIKRRAGVKDSGTMLPGHGGVLDRFDGILLAAPIGYGLLRWWGQ